jgi:hypothetical protein
VPSENVRVWGRRCECGRRALQLRRVAGMVCGKSAETRAVVDERKGQKGRADWQDAQ